jgi:UDP-N-acetylglucosamine--N-acetylmuramyl-(pentapeptide) pyrophosphoryl-undecaprenol N-acetylglucosamine transferase
LIPPRVLLAGGGTGGHLFPALSIAQELDQRSVAVIFVGTRHGIEARTIPETGFPIEYLWLSGFQRGRLLANLLLPIKVVVSFLQSFAILFRYRPEAALGTGGYVCGPILLAATLCGIPFFLQEQNSYPGVTTRLLARRARGVFLNFKEAAERLPHPERCSQVGNPVRMEFAFLDRLESIKKLELNPELPTLLIFGGSQGARKINQGLREALPELGKLCNVIWSRGNFDKDEITSWVGPGKLLVNAFISDMATVYAASDLAICRSGAMTLSELSASGLPAILVPYPHAAADHQKYNALSFVKSGGALMIEDKDFSGKILLQEVSALFSDRKRLETMRHSLQVIPKHNPASIIADTILKNLKGNSNV